MFVGRGSSLISQRMRFVKTAAVYCNAFPLVAALVSLIAASGIMEYSDSEEKIRNTAAAIPR